MNEFSEVYEHFMQFLESENEDPIKEREGMRKKREYGLLRYKELAFQSSHTNAMNVPAVRHIIDELWDAANYTKHALFMLDRMNINPQEKKWLGIAIDDGRKILRELKYVLGLVRKFEKDTRRYIPTTYGEMEERYQHIIKEEKPSGMDGKGKA